MQPRILLCTFTPRAHCWLKFNLLSTRPSGPFFTAIFYLASPQHVLMHALLTTGLHSLPHHSPHIPPIILSHPSAPAPTQTSLLPFTLSPRPQPTCLLSAVALQISFFLFLNSWQFFLPPPPLDSDYSPVSICHWFHLHSWLSPQEKQKLDPGCSYQKSVWMYSEERKRAAVWE